jgi:5-methylcytosine-specific restriction endonuclease McrA
MVLFLLYPSKVYKLLPITTCTLPKNVRQRPYYIHKEAYADHSAKILNRRTTNESFRSKLYLKQKGLCGACHLPLTAQEPPVDNPLSALSGNLEIHHIKPIGKAYQLGKQKEYNNTKNMILLHEECHQIITNQNYPNHTPESSVLGD